METPLGLADAMVLARTGQLPRPPEHYSQHVLTALLVHGGDALDAFSSRHESADVDDGPVATGDPIADEWEAAIARGETPDFDAR